MQRRHEHHPTAASVAELIGVFERCIERNTGYYGPPELDMGAMDVSADCTEMGPPSGFDGICGTTACHSGWYLLAKHQEQGSTLCICPRLQTVHEHLVLDGQELEHELSWTEGRVLMAEDLGFACHEDLQFWAEEYPEYWGGDDGALLFGSERAFRHVLPPPGEGEPSLHHIVEHWRGVHTRLVQRERALQEIEGGESPEHRGEVQ